MLICEMGRFKFANAGLFRGLLFLLMAGASFGNAIGQTIDFNRDIRPILSDNCYKCHGPDEHDRQAGLRLDSQDGLIEAHDLLAPGDADDSELYRRLITDDDSELMPPEDSGRVLDDQQKELIRRWIDQGAPWQDHWSFVKPQRPDVPQSRFDDWGRSAIDRFIGQKLEQSQLTPNVEASRHTLLRRVALDLTGLPPTEELVKRYANDRSIDWYERLVDELLQSPNYGEHMARHWLDAARYGDTHGLHLDNYREMWLYRDWVVDAYNRNLSYKDFLIEQLAGDLVESPTQSQLIATGFNRAHVTTNEGGSIYEEVLVRNVVDRVSTTSTVFLGLTVACAQCHDHKYDPISQKEFYQLFAFFNSLDANAMDGNAKAHAPIHRQLTPEQDDRLAAMRTRIKELDVQMEFEIVDDFDYTDPVASKDQPPITTKLDKAEDFVWFDDTLPPSAKPTGEWLKKSNEEIEVLSGESAFVATTKDFTQNYFLQASPQLHFSGEDRFFVNVYLDPEDPPREIMLQFNDGNWNHRAFWGQDLINFGKTGTPQRLRIGDLPESGKWVRLEVDAKACWL